MKNTFFLSLFLFISVSLFGAKIDRAFKALNAYNYFEAKGLFYKSLEKEPIAAPYGLSIIYARNDNPFYQLDSAYLYILMADINYERTQLSSREQKKLKDLNADSMQIQAWKDTVDWLVYQQALKKAQISTFQKYIDRHLDSDWRDRAIFKRDSMAFYKARQVNSSSAFLSFLEEYPNSSFFVEAKNRMDERLFYEAVEENTFNSYISFLENYPENPFNQQAQDSLYKLATEDNKLKSYYDFIYRFPENRNVEKAWRMLYTLYTQDGNPEKIVEFRLDYPDYPYVEELVSDFKLAATTFFPYQKEAKWGYVDENGDVRIPPQYDYAAGFNKGVALVIKADKIGYIDKSNQVLIPFQYDDGEDYKKGLIVALKGDYLGIINKANQVILPFEYDEIGALDQDLILVSKNNRYGYVNHQGEIAIPLQYNRAYDFQGPYALAIDSGKYGVIGKGGNVHVPFVYSWLESFNPKGYCRAKKDSLFGLLDWNGGEILPFIYSHIGESEDSLLLIEKDGKYGYASIRGNIQISPQFDFVPEALTWGTFKNGYAKFKKKDKYGIVNWQGREVFPAIFEDIGEYSDTSFVAVKKRGKWGYSNQKLSLVLPYKYEVAKTFAQGLAFVKLEGVWKVIDEKGKFINEENYQELKRVDQQMILAKTEEGWGLINLEGKVVLHLQYDQVEEYKGSFLRFLRDEGSQYYEIGQGKLLLDGSLQ